MVVEVHTVADAIRCHAELNPDRLAVVGTNCPSLSYGQLFQALTRLRGDLREAGFGPSARVVVAVPSGPVAAVAVVAIACCATAVPLDTKLAPPEVDRRLSLLRPAAVVLWAGDDSPVRTIAAQRHIPIIEIGVPDDAHLDLRLMVPRIGTPPEVQEPAGDAIAFILQTSGTTGEPKLIPYSHSNMLAAAARVQGWFGLGSSDRCLCVSPIHYSHGLKVTLFTPLITGGSVAFPADPSLPDIVEWMEHLRPTWYSAAPPLHRYLLDKLAALPQAVPAHRLRFIVSGGAPLAPELNEALSARLGIPVLEHYGSSEAAQMSANLPPPGPSKPGTCGVPPKDLLIVAGEDNRRAAPMELGEVLVRGPTVISGYLDAPELNRAMFADGWFRTGDIGSIDYDGFLRLHGRKSELINRGGEKVSPVEVDDALLSHPSILEAAAFAVSHPRLGEDVAAAVVLKPGASATPGEIRMYLTSRLAAFKIPRRIVFVDRLPKGPTGKVQRRLLTEELK